MASSTPPELVHFIETPGSLSSPEEWEAYVRTLESNVWPTWCTTEALREEHMIQARASLLEARALWSDVQ